jgi:hypothetical protein
MSVREIPLSKGYIALIDECDFERVAQYKWTVVLGYGDVRNRTPYAYRADRSTGKQVNILLHRFILNAPKGMRVDHKDLNGLNCTRKNLRLCTASQNQHNRDKQANNTSGYKGVSSSGVKAGRFRAVIRVNDRTRHLGVFDTALEAARCYDEAAARLHGEFAKLNSV